MLPDSLATPVIVRVAAGLFTAAARRAVSNYFTIPAVEAAIRKTADEYSDIEAVAHCLRRWAEGGAFQRILGRFRSKEGPPPVEALVRSFVDDGRFFLAQDQEETAGLVVGFFIETLKDELYESDGFRQIGRQTERILGSVDELRAEVRDLASRSVDLPDGDLGDPRLGPLQARIDTCRDLIDSGDLSAARRQLTKIRESDQFREGPAELRFRVLTNLGACALQLSEYEEAFQFFSLAREEGPDSPKALANAAVGNLMVSRFGAAIDLARQALEKEPRNGHAAAALVQALHRTDEAEKVDEFIAAEPWIITGTDSALSCASVYADRGDHERSRKILEDKLAVTPDDAVANHMLGSVIVEPVQARLRALVPLPNAMDEEDRKELELAEVALSRSVEAMENREATPELGGALVTRAAVRAFLGDEESALRDCERARGLRPDDPALLRNLAILLFHQDRPAEAFEQFKQIPRWEEDAELVVDLSRAGIDAGEVQEAIGYLAALRARIATDDPAQIRIADTLLWMRESDRQRGQALLGEIIKDLEGALPEHPEALRVRALALSQSGDAPAAIALLRKALGTVEAGADHRVRMALADLVGKHGDPQEAADCLAPLIELARDDYSLLAKYAVNLFNAGRFKEVTELAEKARGDGPAIPTITELEAIVAQYVGDPLRAISLRRMLAEVDEDRSENQAEIVGILLAHGRRDDALQALSEIDSEGTAQSSLLMRIAHLKANLGVPGAVEDAYRALRLGFNNPDIQLGYLGLFFTLESEETVKHAPEEVAVGCAVHLHAESGATTVTIVEGDPGKGEGWEVSPDDEVARALLGKRAGTQVVLKANAWERVEYQIQAIQSRHLWAAQQIQANFTTRFPSHQGLQRIDVSEDFSRVFQALDRREADVVRIMADYRQQFVTVGALARAMGATTVDAWEFITQTDHSPLVASSGTEDEIQAESDAVGSATSLVVDLTAVCSIVRMELVDEVAQRFPKVMAHTSAMVALASIDEQLRRRPTATTWRHNGEYHMREITEEDWGHSRASLTRLVEYLERKTKMVPAGVALELGRERCDELSAFLGHEGFFASLVAMESESVLCTADLRLRNGVNTHLGVQSCSIQALLKELRRSEIIDEDQYRSRLFQLSDWSYRILEISADDLTWLIARDRYELTPTLRRAFENFAAPCPLGTATETFCELVRAISLEGVLENLLMFLLDGMLEALVEGRNAPKVIAEFKRTVAERLLLLPHQRDRVLGRIDMWERFRTL